MRAVILAAVAAVVLPAAAMAANPAGTERDRRLAWGCASNRAEVEGLEERIKDHEVHTAPRMDAKTNAMVYRALRGAQDRARKLIAKHCTPRGL